MDVWFGRQGIGFGDVCLGDVDRGDDGWVRGCWGVLVGHWTEFRLLPLHPRKQCYYYCQDLLWCRRMRYQSLWLFSGVLNSRRSLVPGLESIVVAGCDLEVHSKDCYVVNPVD